MKNKIVSLVIMLVMILSFTGFVFASSNDSRELTRDSYRSASIHDINYNWYSVQASTSAYSSNADVWTYFKNTYVNNGSTVTQQDIYEAEKTLGSYGTTFLSGGGSGYPFGSLTNTVSYTLEASYDPSGSYLYNVISVTGQHLFSYNGAYWNVVTYYPE